MCVNSFLPRSVFFWSPTIYYFIDIIVSGVLILTGHSGSVRRSHEQHQGSRMRIRGKDRPADVLPIGGDWPSCSSVGGCRIHWRRRVPRISKRFDPRRWNRM